uniref:Uncharacterized protein n=2 Tax=Brassica TaxID=3705 RepID=M4F2C5_BRACM
MAKALDFLSDLQNSRSSSTVQVSLLRFWDARNVRRGGDLMGVDMLLLDSQENLMLRQQLEAIVQENSLLKQAVVKQQKWQRETEDQSQELQPLRQLFT